jgi:hypothetical protein
MSLCSDILHFALNPYLPQYKEQAGPKDEGEAVNSGKRNTPKLSKKMGGWLYTMVNPKMIQM